MAKEVWYDFQNCSCYCDCLGCRSEELVESTDFSEINKELRGMGWVTTKIGAEWLDFCCQECLKRYKENHEK